MELDRDVMALAARNSREYGSDYDKYDFDRQQRRYEQPAKVLVVNGDCLDTVRCFKKKYPTSYPVVLNMANAHSPGGGWRDGLSSFPPIIGGI